MDKFNRPQFGQLPVNVLMLFCTSSHLDESWNSLPNEEYIPSLNLESTIGDAMSSSDATINSATSRRSEMIDAHPIRTIDARQIFSKDLQNAVIASPETSGSKAHSHSTGDGSNKSSHGTNDSIEKLKFLNQKLSEAKERVNKWLDTCSLIENLNAKLIGIVSLLCIYLS